MKISCATVHVVIPESDAGAIVMRGAVAVADDDTAAVNRYAQMGFRPHSHIERFFGTTGLLILSRE